MGENDAIRELEERVAKMRALGVTRWGDIELGPEPPKAAEAQTKTQSKSRDQLEQEQRLARRAISLAASGRLVPRLGEND